jgi:hypothetical protein
MLEPTHAALGRTRRIRMAERFADRIGASEARERSMNGVG